MMIPNEIISEILEYHDYLRWKSIISQVNQQYHAYYDPSEIDTTLCCHQCELLLFNWRYIYHWKPYNWPYHIYNVKHHSCDTPDDTYNRRAIHKGELCMLPINYF